MGKERGACLRGDTEGMFHDSLKALFPCFEEVMHEFLASYGIRYAGIFGWVIVSSGKSAYNESSVVLRLVPEFSRYRGLGGLPIADPCGALILVEFHSSLGEGFAEVLKAFISYLRRHYERYVVHISSYMDTSSSVGHHLGVARNVPTEVFFRLLHEE